MVDIGLVKGFGLPRLILIMPDTSPRGEGVPDEDPKAAQSRSGALERSKDSVLILFATSNGSHNL